MTFQKRHNSRDGPLNGEDVGKREEKRGRLSGAVRYSACVMAGLGQTAPGVVTVTKAPSGGDANNKEAGWGHTGTLHLPPPWCEPKLPYKGKSTSDKAYHKIGQQGL